ncbi:hypothetical protein CMQ_845 [Grosmannia clavigera kw1407]|uniref:Uncharacterized protein n=1 Tax=Grosmannia clavigera (strain kw1407 / UAMH 11150) TaxID=655863 RepID=F0XE12_GROCL|nr:uncharacterized protein CMQ_845 [Grosmannia clavigera kw1407]EFX03917.1 hypothetical protein CMQ_845 [Grosmannia clavigera kw1407]
MNSAPALLRSGCILDEARAPTVDADHLGAFCFSGRLEARLTLGVRHASLSPNALHMSLAQTPPARAQPRFFSTIPFYPRGRSMENKEAAAITYVAYTKYRRIALFILLRRLPPRGQALSEGRAEMLGHSEILPARPHSKLGQ